MLKRTWNASLAREGALVVAVALAAPVGATADIFGWRTEDGVFAYTDDRDNIPARYADQAVAVRDTRLAEYPRLTIEDTQASRAVSSRLAKRLDYLRQVNAADAVTPATTAAAPGRTTVSVATGSAQVPTLDIATDAEAAPIVVEPIISRGSDEVRTRRTTLVKQGDHTLAVIHGRSHHIDVNEDIYEEEELLEPR
jgi:hypothetical protein